MKRLITALCLLATAMPAMARPDRDHHERRFDPAAERRAERRWERRRDEGDRRERMERMNSRGAFDGEGNRRRFYEDDESED